MHYFSYLFGKELYMFRKDLLSIIRSLNTVFTALCIWCLTHKNCEVFQRAKEERLLLEILKN
jgi:uncharacterized membrane protein